jgi:hypothetical protein
MKDTRIKKGDQIRAARDLLAEGRNHIKKGCRGHVLGWMEHTWKVRWFGHGGSMPIGWHLPNDLVAEKDWPKKKYDRSVKITPPYIMVRELIEALELLPDDRLPIVHPVGMDWAVLRELPRPILVEPVPGTHYYRPASKKTTRPTELAVAVGLRTEE